MQLIDTHVHLNFEVFQSDLPLLRKRWREAEVAYLIHSCVEPTEFEAIRNIADQIPEMSFAVGLHPLDAQKWTGTSAGEILSLAQTDERVVAIGEMGLDFYKAQNHLQQQEVLEAQLAIAHQLNKPVIIHCRDAASELRDILQRFWQTTGPVSGVMHCWGGTPEETNWFLDLGFHISFSGIITFKNAHTVRESAQCVPLDRLLIETDCPFLAPVPHRGQRNEPAYVRDVAQYLTQIKQISLDKLAAQTTANAQKLFNLREIPAEESIEHHQPLFTA